MITRGRDCRLYFPLGPAAKLFLGSTRAGAVTRNIEQVTPSNRSEVTEWSVVESYRCCTAKNSARMREAGQWHHDLSNPIRCNPELGCNLHRELMEKALLYGGQFVRRQQSLAKCPCQFGNFWASCWDFEGRLL